MKRRNVLLSICTGLGLLSGCSETNGDQTVPTTRTDEDSRPPTATAQSPTKTPSPQTYLPEPGEGWELIDTSDYVWAPIGGSEGIIGKYRGPDGETYKVVIMRDEDNADGSARQFSCAGWQIAFAYRGYAIAASTGTLQKTFTPEAPPTMSSSPAPNKTNRVYELLLRSPKLTEDIVPEETTCPYD